MNASQSAINWVAAFEAVCQRSREALDWDLPEPWVHAELYAELNRCSDKTGWRPIPKEIPYVTHYPVQLPTPSNRDWKVRGGVKWADLCLRQEAENAWCWFELKVRHSGTDGREQQASSAARDAFRKDVIALVGFSTELTAQTWQAPDEFTKIYWADTLLKPHCAVLRSGRQDFVAAYLQLNGGLPTELWSEAQFRKQLESWLVQRSRYSATRLTLPTMDVSVSSSLLAGRHTLLLCKWTAVPPILAS